MRRRLPLLLALAAIALAAVPGTAQREIEIVLGGDVIFDAPIAYAIDRFFDDRSEPALAELFSELAPVLTRADLAIVNLECPIAPRIFSRSPEHDLPTFAAPREFAEAIAHAGIDALIVANNHAYDQGVGGLARTLLETERAGMITIGAGEDLREAGRAVVTERGGIRIAIAAFTEGSNRRVRAGDPETPRIAIASEDAIEQSVREARARAELVIASLHWTGTIDHDRPTHSMRRLARAAVEAGADLVFGHGTHLPGPRETLRASDGRVVPVLWSLGNLIAVMEEDEDRVHAIEPSVRDAVLARLRIAPGARAAVTAIEAEPYWIARPERAWWTGSTSAMVRPLSVRAELERIERAGCGARCARFARSYRGRERMIAQLISARTAAGSGTASGTEAEPAPTSRPEARSSADTERSAGSPSERRTRMVPIEGELGQGIALRISFPHGGARESSVDEAQVRELAAMLLADRALRVEIIARVRASEPPSLAMARAHRAGGGIAIRGPSRARFTLRAAEPSDEPRITIRIRRRLE